MEFVKTVFKQKSKKAKAYFDEILEGITVSNPKKRFCVTVFLPMMDILSCQLINRFEEIKSVVNSYQVLKSSFPSNVSHLDLEVEARNFFNKFSDNVSPLFPSQMLSIKTPFRGKIAGLNSAKEMASFLSVENASLATTYPDVCTGYMMYMIVLVTVFTAERSFSELQLIKNFLRSSMSQERLSSLALLSIQNEQAKYLDFRKAIQQFTSANARRKNFKFPTSRK